MVGFPKYNRILYLVGLLLFYYSTILFCYSTVLLIINSLCIQPPMLMTDERQSFMISFIIFACDLLEIISVRNLQCYTNYTIMMNMVVYSIFVLNLHKKELIICICIQLVKIQCIVG